MTDKGICTACGADAEIDAEKICSDCNDESSETDGVEPPPEGTESDEE